MSTSHHAAFPAGSPFLQCAGPAPEPEQLLSELRALKRDHRDARTDVRKIELDAFYRCICTCLKQAALLGKDHAYFAWDPAMDRVICHTVDESFSFADIDEPDVVLMLREKFERPGFTLTFVKDGAMSSARRFYIKF